MCMAAPSSCPYSPKCLEAAFSEVPVAPVQDLWASLAEIVCGRVLSNLPWLPHN